ncbi:MAG TPA: TonB family protein [Polyangia bacterium]|nr:TonB family protein [Polyangia bacterium]
MTRALVPILTWLAIGSFVSAARAQDANDGNGPVVTKPPKLVTFVPAVYPKDKHDAGVTASVLLSIEIGDDGKVGEVEVVKGAAPDFDAAAVAAAKQFVFEPAEIDHQPAPVKITYRYDFTIVEEIVKTGPQINFDGVILERFKKRPLPRVAVTLKDLGGLQAMTDQDGHFAFLDLPPGKHKLEITNPRLMTITTEETIAVGKRRTVKYYLEEKEEGVDDAAVVRAPRIKKEAVETRIRTEEARRVPGTQGDTLKVVQNLPGVARSSFGSGDLIIWGSAPNETKVNVDGVEIPSLYHVGGFRSTINSDLVRSIDLSPGSYGAEYGRGLGGLVRIDLGPLPKDGTHGYVAADLLDTSALISTAITPRLRLAVSGRISYLDKELPLVTSQDVGDFVPIPRYDDYQARATLQLRQDEEIAFTFLASDDHLRRAIPSDDPTQVRSENTDSGWRRFIVHYTRLLPDGASVVVTPSFGYDSNSDAEQFGSTPVDLESHTWQFGLRSSYRRRVAPSTTLSFGIDMQARSTTLDRLGSLTLPAREGDITVFGQPPRNDIAKDHWNVLIIDTAPFLNAEINVGRLSLVPGLRFEPTLIEGSPLIPTNGGVVPPIGYSSFSLPVNPVDELPNDRVSRAIRAARIFEYLPNPRLSAAFRATRRLTLTAGGGIYGQPPDPQDMSPVFGNPNITLSRAAHLSGGFSYKLRPTLTLEVIGFYKRLWDLVSRNENPSPPLADSLTQDEIGRAYGGQVLLRQELLHGFFGWVTYSWTRSERRDHPDTDWRLFDYDQTQALGIVASYQLGHGWDVGTRFRYTTGFPRTPVIGAYYDAANAQYDPVFGAHNSIRIPSFYQLDARLEKSITYRRLKINLFLDVQNITDRQNPEEIIYNYNFTQRAYITGFPTLAIVGARLEF